MEDRKQTPWGLLLGATITLALIRALPGIPAFFFAQMGFAFSLTAPPGEPYHWGEMLLVIVLFFVVPVALSAMLGRSLGGIVATFVARLSKSAA